MGICGPLGLTNDMEIHFWYKTNGGRPSWAEDFREPCPTWKPRGRGKPFLGLLERVFFGPLLTVLDKRSSEWLKKSLPGFLVGWVVGLTGGTLGLMTPQGVIRPRVPRAAAPAAGPGAACSCGVGVLFCTPFQQLFIHCVYLLALCVA